MGTLTLNEDSKVKRLDSFFTSPVASIALALALSACAPGQQNSAFRSAGGSFQETAGDGAPVILSTSAPQPPTIEPATIDDPDAPVASDEIVVTGHREPAQPPAQASSAPAPQTASAQPAAKPAAAAALPPTSLPIPAWAKQSQGETWTRITIRALKELGTEMIKTDLKDAHDFCPTYHRLADTDREKVWVQLISSMAKYESDFDPTSTYTESFKGDDGTHIISRGLLQISKNSANLYGCNIAKPEDLQVAETNLRCGVRILNTLVTKYKAIHGQQDVPNVNLLRNPWQGAARYWSVLRRKTKDLLIRSSVRQLAVCKH